MFLGYGGRPVLKCLGEVNADIANEILAALISMESSATMQSHATCSTINALGDV